MKQIVAVATACCVFLACASSGAKIAPPQLDFVQLSGPAEQSYTQGDIEVQYGIRIANRAAVPITLRNIQVQTAGLGGSYRLRPGSYYFQREIAPEQYEDVTFWAKAIAQGDAMSSDANAPITVRVTAIFDSPSGGFRRVFSKMLAQR
jgi:hypothetical protein